jgi:glycosyltransferase involved in cell wall biosynthesis
MVFPNGRLASRPRRRVLLLVSSLQRGGAERQVVELANHLDRFRFEVTVLSLSEDVPLAADLAESVRLQILPKRWRFDAAVLFRAARWIRRLQPHIVHGFLFDAEMVARVAGRLANVPLVLGSERNSDYRPPRLQVMCQRLSRRWCHALVANSEAGRRFAIESQKLPAGCVRQVANGVDTDCFRPHPMAAARKALQLPTDVPLVGMVASIKPQKNYAMFVDFARRLRCSHPEVQFLCVGAALHSSGGLSRLWRAGAGLHGDTERYERQIAGLVATSGLQDAIHWRANIDDMPSVYNACDAMVLTSDREGTPNCVLEAMACARPVAVTDVADNARIILHGETGFVVPKGAAEELARHVRILLEKPLLAARLGRAGRLRCEREYSLAVMAGQMAAVYEEQLDAVCNRVRKPRGNRKLSRRNLAPVAARQGVTP